MIENFCKISRLECKRGQIMKDIFEKLAAQENLTEVK